MLNSSGNNRLQLLLGPTQLAAAAAMPSSRSSTPLGSSTEVSSRKVAWISAGHMEFQEGPLGLLFHATRGLCAVPGQSREVTDCSIRVRNLSFYHFECFAAATTTNPATPGMFIRPISMAFEKASPHACIPQAAEISLFKKNPTP